MSLLGRLEDLSLTDIVQIVFLSRRTGVLEIVDRRGRHTVVFRNGLVVNASTPDHPDLLAYLVARGVVPSGSVGTLQQMAERGIPCGTAVVELSLLKPDDLAEAIRSRIVEAATPLLQSREGEFNFILSETMDVLDMEYDPAAVFKEGGIPPQRIIGTADGEKLKPLRGLEESLKAGKALLRGAAPEPSAPSLDLGLGHAAEERRAAPPPDQAREEPFADLGAAAPDEQSGGPSGNIVPFPARKTAFAPISDAEPPPEAAPATPVAEDPSAQPGPAHAGDSPAPAEHHRPAVARFRVAGGLFDIETPEAQYRNVVLYERNPLVRVAAKRAFAKRNVKIAQYGELDGVRAAMTELFQSNSFFVTFLELAGDDSPVRLMQQLKRRNPRLPVVIVDAEADLRRRHDLLRAGADLYLTKPSPARLQPGLAEEELALFADELVLFCERAFTQWEEVTGGLGPDAGRRFYELASKDSMDRSFLVLKQLINELSNPNDIGLIAATILRLSSEYLERGALFMVGDEEFIGLGGFGVAGGGESMDERVKSLRVRRGMPSALADVVSRGAPHRGKMRKTVVNVEIVERLGGQLPTEVVVLPILHGGRTIGILYGDNAEHRAPIDSVSGLEIFLSQAGYAFGNAVFATEKARR